MSPVWLVCCEIFFPKHHVQWLVDNFMTTWTSAVWVHITLSVARPFACLPWDVAVCHSNRISSQLVWQHHYYCDNKMWTKWPQLLSTGQLCMPTTPHLYLFRWQPPFLCWLQYATSDTYVGLGMFCVHPRFSRSKQSKIWDQHEDLNIECGYCRKGYPEFTLQM